MIVGNADVEGVAIDPAEDDAPLLVDADAVVSRQLAPQGLKAVSRGYSKIVQTHGSVDQLELAQSTPTQIGWDPARASRVLAGREVLRSAVPKAPNHCNYVTLLVTHVKPTRRQRFVSLYPQRFVGRWSDRSVTKERSPEDASRSCPRARYATRAT